MTDPEDDDDNDDDDGEGPEDLADALADLEDDDGDDDGDDADDSEEPEEPDDDVEDVVYADVPVPKLKDLRKALEWAFESEDDLPADFLDRCAEHALLVQEKNRVMNVTRIVEPKEIAAKHYLDCWRTTRLLPLLGRRVLDIGTGAGYPGIPIALAEPHAQIVMMDSTQKKAEFVQECIEKMGIPNASCIAGRGEEHLLRNRYDVVVMRAISSVRENVRLLRKVRHSLYDLVMMKGSSWSREVRAGEREAERLGFHLDTILEHELPGEMGGRAVLVYRAPGGHGR